jgi:hypothetical protein
MTKISGMKRFAGAAVAAAVGCSVAAAVQAHHSFAMYDVKKVYVMTGIVTRVDPNPNHLQIFFAPLNEARDQVLKDPKGEPWVWAVEMDGAAIAARHGITVNNFPRGTIISVGLHPLRNGYPAGGRGKNGLFKGGMAYGEGELPATSDPLPPPTAQ